MLRICFALALASATAPCVYAQETETRYRYDRSGNIIEISPEVPGTPVVDGFDPGFGSPGDTITIHGRSFSSVAAENLVEFGPLAADVVEADVSTLRVVVPAGANSGPVTVFTPSGSSSSTYPFVVLPSDMVASAIGGHSAAGPVGSPQFLGLIGGYWGTLAIPNDPLAPLSLTFLGIDQDDSSPVSYRVLSSAGEVLASGTLGATSPSIHFPIRPAGEGLVLAMQTSGWSRVHFRLDPALPLISNGAHTAMVTEVDYQTIRASFEAMAGESYGIGFTSANAGATNRHILINIYRPDGTYWQQAKCGSSYVRDRCHIVARDLPADGTYTLIARLESTTASQQFSINTWLTPEIELDLPVQAATLLELPRKGSIARMRFHGDAGDFLQFAVDQVTNSPAAHTDFLIRSPSGACVVNTNCQPLSTLSQALATVPQLTETGEYEVLVRT